MDTGPNWILALILVATLSGIAASVFLRSSRAMLERIRDLHSTFSIGIEIPLDFRDRSTAEKKKLRGFINQKKYEGLRDSEVTRLASRARIANRVQLLTLPALILLAYLSMRAS